MSRLSLIIACDLILMLAFIDQASKWYVLEHIIRPAVAPDRALIDFLPWLTAPHLERLPFTSIPITSFFNVVMVWNEGISFGALSGQMGDVLIYGLGAIVVAFFIWMVRTREIQVRFALAMVIGGAIGNLWDRIRFGGVADFLDFHAYGWHYWAFNIADSCIVLGILGLIGYELFLRKK